MVFDRFGLHDLYVSACLYSIDLLLSSLFAHVNVFLCAGSGVTIYLFSSLSQEIIIQLVHPFWNHTSAPEQLMNRLGQDLNGFYA